MVNLEQNNYRNDVILKEPDATGNRRLLVRILENTNYDGSTPPARLDTLDYFNFFNGEPYNPNPNWERPRLLVESNSVAPNFKVMLYPHYAGDALPNTNWDAINGILVNDFDGLEHTTLFTKNDNGRTEISVPGPPDAVAETADSKGVTIFPNPAKDYITLDIPTFHAGLTAEIYDAKGHLLQQENITTLTQQISTTTLVPGSYIVRLTDGTKVWYSSTFVKVK